MQQEMYFKEDMHGKQDIRLYIFIIIRHAKAAEFTFTL
jgi:hypothetical protein